MKTISLKAAGMPRIPEISTAARRRFCKFLSTATLTSGVVLALAGLLLIAAGNCRGQILEVAALACIDMSLEAPFANKYFNDKNTEEK